MVWVSGREGEFSLRSVDDDFRLCFCHEIVSVGTPGDIQLTACEAGPCLEVASVPLPLHSLAQQSISGGGGSAMCSEVLYFSQNNNSKNI